MSDGEAKSHPGVVPTKVQLVSQRGATSIFIEAAIDARGDVVLSGQDIGEAPDTYFGSSDHEYFLRVAAANKDALVLALLHALYADDGLAVSRLRELLDARGIPSEFASF